jgi:hypothetical protein
VEREPNVNRETTGSERQHVDEERKKSIVGSCSLPFARARAVYQTVRALVDVFGRNPAWQPRSRPFGSTGEKNAYRKAHPEWGSQI